jgi:hypothetical protein
LWEGTWPSAAHLFWSRIAGIPDVPRDDLAAHFWSGDNDRSEFEIAWNRRRLAGPHQKERTPLVQDAILLERVLLEGRPALKIVCRVASVIEERLNDPAERDRFWHVAGARLSKLNRLSPRDREEIEGMIAGRIPMPVAASQAAE